VSQRKTIAEAARLDLHSGLLQRTPVLRGRENRGTGAYSLGEEKQSIQTHGESAAQPAFTVMHSEDQSAAGFQRGAATIQQRQLFLGRQVLQNIQNENQAGRG
jgi:hypothetical protein